MDEGHLRRKIQRNIGWCIKLAEDIEGSKPLNREEFNNLVNLIQKESHFLLNNELAKERHQEILNILKTN